MVTTTAPECPRCRRNMEHGFIMDQGHSMAYQSSWIEGEPVWSMWLGLRIKGKRRMKVVTFRCPSCGRLESFANEPHK